MTKIFSVALLLLVGLNAETPFDSTIKPSLVTTNIAPNRGAAAVWQSLKKLHTRASLIMITAHPDDEDGGMLAYESRGLGARVTLLTLNRGEGGANVMSSDYWDALGLVRTEELLAAGQYYGVDQYWTRVCDYGFSKTMQEALDKWGKERVLGDVVRVVRMIRPLVVTSVFVGGPSDGHGNHQVAGLMAKEVFEAAGDPKQFPGQIRQGLLPWKPLKYYAHVPFFGPEASKITKTIGIPEGYYDPFLGLSYVQTSREGLGYQKSQNGGGSIPHAGKMSSDYHRFGSNVPAQDQETSFFDGIDVSLVGIASLAAENNRGFLTDALQKINGSVEQAMSSFTAAHPEKCAPFLATGLKETQDLIESVKASQLSADEKYNIVHELDTKRVQFNDAIIESLGIAMRAVVEPDHAVNPLFAMFMGDPDTFRLAIPGQTFGVRVSIANQTPVSVDVARVYLDGPPGEQNWWTIQAKKPASGTIASGATLDAEFEATASDSIQYTRPYFHRTSIEQPYYDILNAKYLSRPTAPYPLAAWAELKYQDVTVKLGQTVQTAQRANGLGVVYEPLAVAPAISVQLSARAGIVPLESKSFPLSVTIHSNVKGAATGSVELQLPQGWRSEPSSQPFTTSKDGEDQAIGFKVLPAALSQKPYEITAVAKYGGKEYREGYHVTGYPGLRPYFLYDPSTYKTTGVNVKIAPDLKVGYITGSGDDVPASLQNLGINVSFLAAADLAGADFSKFDVILLGVRTYAARPDLITYNQRLLDYVKNGGVLIVQYNTPEFDKNYGPYPYHMGENPEEVTDENSQVDILDPSNPVFSWPNKITEADFRNWIEERGSKFMTTWDPHYEALLETHDPSQAPQKGGLLYAKYGKGIYIYNAYAFYRELPEGVPGAYRLMANMLSLAKNSNR
ncbi:MAG TPA: PIG-L family deacetylase [Bryobacteraceae bacterium]|nr:PIG-L family deacetylase [Bryobacteraceae bacterium]